MLDLLIVAGFVAGSVAAGLRSREKASRNLREYFLAGTTLAGWHAMAGTFALAWIEGDGRRILGLLPRRTEVFAPFVVTPSSCLIPAYR